MKYIDYLLTKITQGLIKLYQYTLSPDKGIPSLWLKERICMHHPHCSQYSLHILQRYGFFRGIIKIMDRVFGCTGGTKKIYDPAHYKVVFFSSAPIGVPFLQKLHDDKRFEVTGVVTMPDAPSGRGMKMKENVIKQEAKKLFGKNTLLSSPFPKGESFRSNLGEGNERDYKCIERTKEDIKQEGLISTGHHLPYNPENIKKAKLLRKNMTQAEKALRNNFLKKLTIPPTPLIKGGKKIKVLRQQPIDHYIVDFYIAKARLVIEIDGEIHDTNEQKQYDQTRTERLHLYGLQILRFSNDEILHNFENVCNKITKIISQPAPPLPRGDKGGINIATPSKLNPQKSDQGKQFTEWLKEKKPDYIVVIAYGKIIPQAILDIPKVAPINVHGSILPKYRGASPIQSVFLDQEKQSGITIMKMVAELDAGNMIDVLKTKLKFDWTAKDLITRMQTKGPKFLTDTLWKYGKRMLGEIKQDEKQVTFCGKIEKEDGEIDPYTDTLENIYAKYRGFILRPKIYFYFSPLIKGDAFHSNVGEGKERDLLHKKRIVIEQLIIDQKLYEQHYSSPLFSKEKGNIMEKLNPAVTTLLVKPEGKKSMPWDDFIKGYLKEK